MKYMNTNEVRKDLEQESKRLAEVYVERTKQEDDLEWAEYCAKLLQEIYN